MIARVVAQMFLAVTVLRIVPVDAANMEWRIGIPTPPEVLAAPLFALTSLPIGLPVAKDIAVLPPQKTDLSHYGVVTDAQSVFVADTQSGAALFAKNPDDIRPIGSITKLMTALVFLETQPDLDSWVTLEESDYVGGATLHVRFDDGIRLEDVLGASIVGSDNTATQALVRLSGMSQEAFVEAMNKRAAALGMGSSAFTEGTGIDRGNVSTARDTMLMLRAASQSDILVRFMRSARISIQYASGAVTTVDSTDALFDSMLNVKPYAITGGKTGYIPEAGYCFITTITYHGNEVFVAVLGAHSRLDRFHDARELALWAFSTFTWPQL